MLIGLVLIILLVQFIDLKKALRHLTNIPLIHLSIAGLTVLVVLLINTFREGLIFRKFDKFTYLDLITGGLIVKSINIVTPSKSVGRFMGPFIFHGVSQGTTLKNAAKGVILTTSFYSFSFAFCTLGGTLYLLGTVDFYLILLIVVSGMAYLALGAMLLLWIKKTHENSWLRQLTEYFESTFKLKDWGPDFNLQTDLSGRQLLLWFSYYLIIFMGSVFLLRGIRFYFLFWGLGYDSFPLVHALLLPTVSYSVTALPISLGGIGIAEFSASLVLMSFGVPEEIAVTSVFLERSLMVYLPALLASPLTLRFNFDQFSYKNTE